MEFFKLLSGLAALAKGKNGQDGELVDVKEASMMSLAAQFERRDLDQTQDSEGHLMVSVGAEDKSFKRTPVSLTMVLDTSSSMNGRRIELLKETAAKVVNNLVASDEISIVTFACDAEVVLHRQKVGSKERVHGAIRNLRAWGNTNMSGGLLEGFRQVNEKFKGVRRIMLLSDGEPTAGVQDPDGLRKIVKNRDSTCAVSAFSMGIGADQELMGGLAKSGGGNHYYIESGDIGTIFARELGGMVSCIAQNIEVRVVPGKGNRVLDILNDYTVEDVEGTAVISLDDIYAEELKHLLIRMSIAGPEGEPKDRGFSVAHVTVSYDNIKTGKRETHKLNPKVRFVKADKADTDPVVEVEEQIALMTAAKAQLEAVKYADMGNWDGATACLAGAKKFLRKRSLRGSEVAKGLVRSVDLATANFCADTYSAGYGSQITASAVSATKHRATSGGHSADFLGTQFSNFAQKGMVDNFSGDTGGSSPAGGDLGDSADITGIDPADFMPPPGGTADPGCFGGDADADWVGGGTPHGPGWIGGPRPGDVKPGDPAGHPTTTLKDDIKDLLDAKARDNKASFAKKKRRKK